MTAVTCERKSAEGALTAPLASVDIAVRDTFVPAEIGENSRDTRRLGCWVEMPKTGS